ncbi:conserved hypothetical protein [Ricinus communis]|uniref:Reverse transcriptase n=1 Tax=Ricinus communis TaxID=3988 RepID=B9RU21_RICCO|nr:conserved hypothetical protein [Ricinus communis]
MGMIISRIDYIDFLPQAVGALDILGLKSYICRIKGLTTTLFFSRPLQARISHGGNSTSMLAGQRMKRLRGLFQRFDLIHWSKEASGKLVNKAKSSIFFSQNTPTQQRHQLARVLAISHIRGQDKYLGLPAVISKSKKNTFREIKDRIAKRLAGWIGALLSTGGKEIMIKVVTMAVPVYSMSCFALATGLCKDINRLFSKFWWGQIDIQHRVFQGYYFLKSTFLEDKIPVAALWAWQSIIKGRSVLQQGLHWQVGSGLYNVKSCYFIAQQMQMESPQADGARSSSMHPESSMSQLVWSLLVPIGLEEYGNCPIWH